MEAKVIWCFVLVVICLAEARGLKRQDSRYNHFFESSYPGYSSDSYMYSYSSSFPGYGSSELHGFPSSSYGFSDIYGFPSSSYGSSDIYGFPSSGYDFNSDNGYYSSSYGYSGYGSEQSYGYYGYEDHFETLDPVLVLDCFFEALNHEKDLNFYIFADCMYYNGLVPPDYKKRGFKRAPVSSDDGKMDKPEDDGEDDKCDKAKAIFDKLCEMEEEEEKKRAAGGAIGEIDKVLRETCPERAEPQDESGSASEVISSSGSAPKKSLVRQPHPQNRNAGKVMRLINMLKHLN